MKDVNTFAEYMADEERVTKEERDEILFNARLIGKMIEAREEKGISQRKLAKLSGVKQPSIARIETLKVSPQTDTLLKVLYPLGYTLDVVPIENIAQNNLGYGDYTKEKQDRTEPSLDEIDGLIKESLIN